MHMKFCSASLSRAGPRKTNEDTVGVWSVKSDCLCAAVADGLGGMGGGSQASQLAIQLLKRDLVGEAPSEEIMKKFAWVIHENILGAQKANPTLKTMATTLTAISLFRDQLTGVHCGDTRASLARGEGIRRLTVDQAEGERLYRAGKLTKDELFEYPRKHILDSALGMHKAPQIDGFSFPIQIGDKIFLTSDGVHQKVLLHEMREISARHVDPNDFVQDVGALIEERKADDNYSIVAIFVS
jgi:PPM family protein phosphatase